MNASRIDLLFGLLIGVVAVLVLIAMLALLPSAVLDLLQRRHLVQELSTQHQYGLEPFPGA